MSFRIWASIICGYLRSLNVSQLDLLLFWLMVAILATSKQMWVETMLPSLPLLSILCLEIFLLLLKANVDCGLILQPSISQTPRVCHLLFVDDLLILSKESVLSAMNIKDTLILFGSYYGLHANITKSFIIFSQSCENNNEILTIFRFQESSFPIQYLGLPLSSKKLSYAI